MRQDDGHTRLRGRPGHKVHRPSTRTRRPPHTPKKSPATAPLDTKRHSFCSPESLCIAVMRGERPLLSHIACLGRSVGLAAGHGGGGRVCSREGVSTAQCVGQPVPAGHAPRRRHRRPARLPPRRRRCSGSARPRRRAHRTPGARRFPRLENARTCTRRQDRALAATRTGPQQRFNESRSVIGPCRARPRVAALPASPVTARVRYGVCAVMVALVWGWLSLLPVPDSCRVLRAGGRVKGARSARAAAPQAPLTRLPGSGSCQAAGAGSPGGGCGSAVRAGGLSVRGDQPWRPGAGPGAASLT